LPKEALAESADIGAQGVAEGRGAAVSIPLPEILDSYRNIVAHGGERGKR
jgi:hypothetical protein